MRPTFGSPLLSVPAQIRTRIMVVIVGCIVVLACVLGGFTLSGGHVGALIHPAEILTIGGAAFGAMIVMAPVKVLKDLMMAILQSLKGSPFSKKAYSDL